MANRKNKTRNRQGLQVFTLCISTSMVLILLGMVVFTVFTARNLSSYIKENLTVVMQLSEDITDSEAQQLCDNLKSKQYINSLQYISKEQALEEQKKTMGTDPTEFTGGNPYLASVEFQLNADYANNDSLKWISEELTKMPSVTDIRYPEDLVDSINKTLRKISLVLLVLAALLLVVSIVLINNTVKLGIYSRRFNIHTMKLVGASWGFIRKPFIRQGIVLGLIAGIIAIAVLAAGIYGLYKYQPDVMEVITWQVLAITGISVILAGIIITTICSWLSVNHFLKMKAGELYNI
jgi:cell division transport system permease protein